MSTAISYNSFSLQDTNFRTRDIIYRNFPSKTLTLESKPRYDGFRFISSKYESKEISVSGILSRDTAANLKTSLDSLKEALNTDEANLDIDDGGTTLRWVASLASLEIPEEHYHITQIPYRITFRCQPFGKLTTSTTNTNSVSTTPYSSTLNPSGSAPPSPIIKFTVQGTPSAAITAITFNNTTTGDSITISGLVLDSAGDYLKIDTDAFTSVRNYDAGGEVNIDFTGVFPRFVPGSNSYTSTITGGGASWSLLQEFIYYTSYL